MTSARAVFQGVEIPESLLATELQNHQAASLSDARALAGRALAAKAVLLARGRELGLVAEPERNGDGQEETPEEALIRVVLSEEVDAEPPSQVAIRAVYDGNPEGFRSPPLLEASHILIAPSETKNPQAWEAARLEALALIANLTGKPSEFARVAASRSACPSASEGGSLGQLGPGNVLRVIWDALVDMDIGTIGAAPVASEHGWHVLRLDQRSDGERLPFDYVCPHIAMQLEARAWTKAAAVFVDQLLSESAARRRLCLTESGELDTGEGIIKRADGLLGEALGDARRAYDALGEAARERLKRAANESDEAAEELLARSIRTFLSKADDEAWTQLISRLRESETPLADSLEQIVSHQLPPVHKTRTLITMRSGPRTSG